VSYMDSPICLTIAEATAIRRVVGSKWYLTYNGNLHKRGLMDDIKTALAILDQHLDKSWEDYIDGRNEWTFGEEVPKVEVEMDNLPEGLVAAPQYVEASFGRRVAEEHRELVVLPIYPEGLNVEVGDNLSAIDLAIAGWRDKRYVRQDPK